MKTTLRIKHDLYRAAKARAALEGVTITKFIEAALEAKLQRDTNQPRCSVELSTFDGDGFPYSPQELKRLIQDSQMQYDVKNLDVEQSRAASFSLQARAGRSQFVQPLDNRFALLDNGRQVCLIYCEVKTQFALLCVLN